MKALKDNKGVAILAKELIYDKLAEGGNISLEQRMTEAELASLIIEFEEACSPDTYPGETNPTRVFGGWDKEKRSFWCNDTTGITPSEAAAMLASRLRLERDFPYMYDGNNKIRTNICNINVAWMRNIDLNSICSASSTIEELVLSQNKTQVFNAISISGAFMSLNLRKVSPAFSISGCTNAGSVNTAFTNAKKLEHIEMQDLKVSISFKDCPLLSCHSLQYLIQYAANTNAITITVHPDIYAAMLGEAGEYPFNGGTSEQWQQLFLDAQAKNITFATA